MKLFEVELDFLGHHILCRGIEVNGKKVDKILSWPTSWNMSEVRSFLRLVYYISNFLSVLAQHTFVFTPFMTKKAEKDFV